MEEKNPLRAASVVAYLCQLWLLLYAANSFYQIFISENGKVLDLAMIDVGLISDNPAENSGVDLVTALGIKGLPVVFVLIFLTIIIASHFYYRKGKMTGGTLTLISIASVVMMYVLWPVVLVPLFAWVLTIGGFASFLVLYVYGGIFCIYGRIIVSFIEIREPSTASSSSKKSEGSLPEKPH